MSYREDERLTAVTMAKLSGFSGSILFLASAAIVLQACSSAPGIRSKGPSLPEPVTSFENPGDSVSDYLSCLRAADVMLVTGHRGGPSAGYPENAIETFAHTLAYGPMLIEADIRMTRDGVLILMHDETLNRTTTGSGPVAETTLADIKKLFLVDNAGAVTPYRAPTLAEAISWARDRAILQLDVKHGAPIEMVAADVSEAYAAAFAAVVAYTIEDAMAAAAVDPNLTLSVEMMDVQRLDDLVANGLSENRLMAWTGVETERPALWEKLNERGVSTAWGSLWYIDEAVRKSGDPSAFIRLAAGRLDVLSSDLHFMAFDAAETLQRTSKVVMECNNEVSP